MVNLYDEGTGEVIGAITEEQFQFMVDQLEEESTLDQDYTISQMLLAYFEELNADPELVTLLRNALGNRDEMEITWD
ncbi:MAG: monogalactosyldiacylglycerol synthase [Chloroflexi bacterium]|jgi:processive 1,2-diacylglycerol beta-glucosyltransferase|nr:monogalactosyldiacylglycerol synthase [Chloroflexota bacterium]